MTTLKSTPNITPETNNQKEKMATKRPLIAVQLYTLRDQTKDDMAAVLRRVKEIGYEGVELAGYGDLTREGVKRVLDETGLVVTSNHVAIERMENDFEDVVEEARLFGYSTLGVAYLDAVRRTTKEKWLETAQTLNALGKRLREEAGLQLFYHNHAFEFEERFDGEAGLDILYSNTDSQFVQAELDTYWVKKGGEDPVEYLRKYGGRTPVLHIKDMNESGDFAEVGTGMLDWPAIFEAAEAGGVSAYIVEQDVCPGNPLDSIALSFENLKRMGKV
jgi:sugar phosphate isomerase/epimerase